MPFVYLLIVASYYKSKKLAHMGFYSNASQASS